MGPIKGNHVFVEKPISHHIQKPRAVNVLTVETTRAILPLVVLPRTPCAIVFLGVGKDVETRPVLLAVVPQRN